MNSLSVDWVNALISNLLLSTLMVKDTMSQSNAQLVDITQTKKNTHTRIRHNSSFIAKVIVLGG